MGILTNTFTLIPEAHTPTDDTVQALIDEALALTRPKVLPPQWTRAAYPLRQFVEEGWGIIEPERFVPGWHLDALCQHLQAVTDLGAGQGESASPLRNLCINVPPRTSKSLICAVFWPAWVWVSWPAARFLFLSYSKDLALRDAVNCRTLMQSGWYQQRWGDAWRFVGDQNVKSFYANNRKGYRVTTSIGALATGYGGDFVVGDDVHATQEDLSTTRAEITNAREFWLTTIPSRVTNAKRMCRVVVGQRVAEDDVSAAVLKLGYAHLKIPMEYDPEATAPPTPLGWTDPRTEAGELLCPERFGPREVAEYKASLRHRYYAQYQQAPTTDSASLFPRSWWQHFHVWPDPDWFDVLVQSWDFRFGDSKQTGSFVAGHLWGRKGSRPDGQLYLLDRFFERASFTESVDAMVAMSQQWAGAYAKLIEAKANGPAIYNHLRHKVFGLTLVEVDGRHGSKRARAEAVATIPKARRVWLPHPSLAPWSEDYMAHMQRFPAEPTDDTDASTQAWNYLTVPTPAPNTVRQQARKVADLVAAQQQRRLRQRAVSRTGV